MVAPGEHDHRARFHVTSSYSSPAQLGDRKDAFERDLRQALTDFNPDGRFEELVRTEVIIATRL
ncbi:hypothetical protein [Streptomyces sp. 5-6(2022)]|uniref:hypothetical protein n=1 Tax=Streptomyces sp. 5-6(2022) TaxID=2936510 RepID=UPI0023B94121|nr:hypothetical protein [Streptomyces sp. 5-6(2022)]